VKLLIPILFVIVLTISAFSGCISENNTSYSPVTSIKNLEPVPMISTTGTISSKLSLFNDEEIDGAAYEGDTITFDASESYDPDGEIISYEWIFYDNVNMDTAIVTHIFETADIFSFQGSAFTYSITLVVEDTNHSYSSLEYIIGIIPKNYVFYFDSTALQLDKPSANKDTIKATFGKLRPIETLSYTLPWSVYLQKCRWNATILIEKPILSFLNEVTLTLYNSTGGTIAESTVSFKIFEIKKEKEIFFSGMMDEPTDFTSATISITGFSLRDKIHILYGSDSVSSITFDFSIS